MIGLFEALSRPLLRQLDAVLTAVDVEGAVVWITEYLRYRLNRCGHAAAVEKVMLQIDGRGVQPPC